jgi:hypothetical protein
LETVVILEYKIFKMESSANKSKNSGAAIYGLGFIGALIYFIQVATSFWIGVLGFFKAVLWPAFLVYYLLEFLKK